MKITQLINYGMHFTTINHFSFKLLGSNSCYIFVLYLYLDINFNILKEVKYIFNLVYIIEICIYLNFNIF